jgi:hypothetical protein
VLKKLAEDLALPKLHFQVLRRTIATLAQTKGGVKDARSDLCGADDTRNEAESVKLLENLVRFGTLGILDGLQVIELKGVGA